MSTVHAGPQQQTVQEPTRSIYDSVATAADDAYHDVADDVTAFFRNRDAGPSVLHEGILTVHTTGVDVEAHFIGEEYVGDPSDQDLATYRYVPVDRKRMRQHVQRVYAPLVAAAEYLSTLPDSQQYHEQAQDEIEHRLSGEVTADDANAVLSIAAHLAAENQPVTAQRTVYTADRPT